jgi:hypothetical protein
MTLRALVGVVALNGVYLIVGSSIVWAVRGLSSWRQWASLAGLAYLLGVATLGTVWVLLLIGGVPFGVLTIVTTACAVSLAALGLGRWTGRRLPEHQSSAAALTALSLVTALGVAATGVFLEALFRAGRLQGLYAFDGWAFWIPKAKAIYAFGTLDEQFFTQLPGPTYPPLVPVLDAAAFHAMGSADVVTLHIQYWFFVVGFVASCAGLLSRHAPGWILWPFLLLALVAPRLSGHLLTPQADFLLQFFFCTAAIMACLWLVHEMTWQLPIVTVLLGAAVLTKREGVLLAAILLGALALVSLDRWRRALPRIAAVALGVAAIGLPWRLWYRDHGISGEAPAGIQGDLGRAVDALRLALDVFFDPSLWSVLTALLIATVVVAAIWGDRRQALLVGIVAAAIVLGGVWITVAYPDLPITSDEALNPIVRYLGAVALFGAVTIPLLLAGVWTRLGSRAPEDVR